MTDKRERLHHYLAHVVEAVERIATYTHGVSQDRFMVDQLLQDAVIRNLEIVGEARRNILRVAPEFAEQNPMIPLKSAYEMRNVLAHGYFEVDTELVWRTIMNDLPGLGRQADELRSRLLAGK
mgnify:CR=1 FL=1